MLEDHVAEELGGLVGLVASGPLFRELDFVVPNGQWNGGKITTAALSSIGTRPSAQSKADQAQNQTGDENLPRWHESGGCHQARGMDVVRSAILVIGSIV